MKLDIEETKILFNLCDLAVKTYGLGTTPGILVLAERAKAEILKNTPEPPQDTEKKT